MNTFMIRDMKTTQHNNKELSGKQCRYLEIKTEIVP